MTAPAPVVRTSAQISLPILTISRLKAARSCLRYHKLRYLDGYRPVKESAEARFGTLWHLGLEAWWKAPTREERLDAAIAAVRGAGEPDPFEFAKAEILLVGYDTRWGEERYEVLAVECEFAGPVRNPDTEKESRVWQLGGKMDVVVRDLCDRRVLFMEHKTSSEDIQQGSEYWRRLRMDGQISTYFEGSRFLGYDVQGCLYDVVGKPTLRPLKATPPELRKYTKATKTEPSRLYANQRDHDESVEEYRKRLAGDVVEHLTEYFQRSEIVRLEEEVREGLLDTWVFGQLLREAIRLGRAPRNPDACVRYGRTCEFFDACTGAASLDDPCRFTRSETVHPELAIATTEKREGMEPASEGART